MLDVIKQAALDVIKNSNPTAVMFGTVLSISPLEISVDQRLTLTEAFLIVPESMIRFEMLASRFLNGEETPDEESTTGAKVVLRSGMKQGDKVILLRVQGGQQFVVLDKVVSG